MDGGFVLAFQSIALFVFFQSLFAFPASTAQSLIGSSPHGLFLPSLIASAPHSLQVSALPDPSAATASVAVRVIDDATGRPIKGATVTGVVIADATYVKSTVTDRDGRALLLGLAKGRVRISAGHSGYVPMTYGAERPGEDGTYITIADQQQVPAVTLRLKRGAVAAGTITNEAGEPVVGQEVQAFRRTLRDGQPVFSNALEASDRTDDRGAYRITNLAPGDYVIGVIPYLSEETLQLDPAETADARMDRGDLFRLVESTIPVVTLVDLGGDRAGLSILSGPTPSALGQDRAIGYGPTFYPSAAASTAAVVKLAPAEKRDGLDIRLEPMTLLRVEGRLAGFDESAPVRAIVTLVAAGNNRQVAVPPQLMASTDSSGAFRLSLVPRGQYVLNVRANPADPGRIPMWASLPLSVGDAAITDVVVPLNGGMKVSGEVRFTSSRVEAAVRGLAGVRLTLIDPAQNAIGTPNPSASLQPDGHFEFHDLPPGNYTLHVDGLPYGWLASSAVLDGRDTLDFGLRIEPGSNVEDLVVTITEKMPEVSGTLRDASDRPTTAGWVILFSADNTYWPTAARRTLGVRPGVDGRFVFRLVPPGDYLIAAADAEQGQWQDPSFLEALVPRAMRVEVKDGGAAAGSSIVLRRR